MTLLRASLFAALVATFAAPAAALTIAIDPETGEPLANPPAMFLTLHDAAGDAAGDYVLQEFSFRFEPSPDETSMHEDGRPRFTLAVDSMDAALYAWATSEADTARSLTIEVLPLEAGGIATTYSIEGVTVHSVEGYRFAGEGGQGAASLSISAGGFSLQERTITSIEN